MAALAFLVAVLIAANLILLSTRRPGAMLLPDQRHQDAFRLAGLTARSHPVTDAAGAVQLTFTFKDRCGTPLGLAVIGQIDHENRHVEAETQLWFSLLSASVLPRNPGQPPAPAVTLVRHDLASDLVEGTRGRLELELSNFGVPAPAGAASLRIDNLRGPGAETSATALRPSLRSMVQGAHCGFTPEDLEIFASLARVLRVRICDDLTVPGSRCYNSALTIYRDIHPNTYRLDLRTLGEDHGLLHVSLNVLRDATGTPIEATYRVLPHSSLRKTANLFFTHPRPRGELFLPGDPGLAGLRYLPPIVPQRLRDRRVDLKALLGDTAWFPGSPP